MGWQPGRYRTDSAVIIRYDMKIHGEVFTATEIVETEEKANWRKDWLHAKGAYNFFKEKVPFYKEN